MKLLFAASPLVGHLNPLLTVARIAAARGDEVVFTTTPAFGPRVEAAGFRFLPYAAGGDAAHRETSLPSGPERYRKEFERRFIDAMPGQAAALRDLIASEAPDAIVAGSMFLGVLPLLLDARPRPPIVVMNVSFLFHDRPDLAPLGLGLPPAMDASERARYAAIKAQVDAGFTTPVRLCVDRLLAEMALPGLPAALTQSIVALPDAFLQATVPAFEYDFGALPAGVSFVGTLPAPKSTGPRPDWWSELDDGKPVVLVTQGTLANEDFSELVEPTLRALADRDDILVLATTGGRPVGSIRGPIPANARVAPFLPFDDLLPKVDVLVTNGGYGTVSLALAAGVPIVSAGVTEDKAEIGARVGWSGVGVNIAANAPTADALRAAIDGVLTEPGFRRRAGDLAAAFARHDAPREILAVIDAEIARRGQGEAGVLLRDPRPGAMSPVEPCMLENACP